MALAAEAILAYLMYSNYAIHMAELGRYNVREAYTTGPMATTAKIFYAVFSATVAIGLGAPLLAILTRLFAKNSPPG